MTRLDKVIEQVKAARKGQYRPWIFNEDGNIQENLFVCDILPILDELKAVEIDITDEKIKDIINTSTSYGNTYNWNANTSNNIQWHSKDGITVAAIHLFGDIRAGYSDYFTIQIEDFISDVWNTIEECRQSKDIPSTTMVADLDIFSEGYEVYDWDKGETIGQFYDLELKDLLESIKEDN